MAREILEQTKPVKCHSGKLTVKIQYSALFDWHTMRAGATRAK